jgi:hypothetical protein
MMGWTRDRGQIDVCTFNCPIIIGLMCLCLCFLPFGTGGMPVVLVMAALLGLGRLVLALVFVAARAISSWLFGCALVSDSLVTFSSAAVGS